MILRRLVYVWETPDTKEAHLCPESVKKRKYDSLTPETVRVSHDLLCSDNHITDTPEYINITDTSSSFDSSPVPEHPKTTMEYEQPTEPQLEHSMSIHLENPAPMIQPPQPVLYPINIDKQFITDPSPCAASLPPSNSFDDASTPSMSHDLQRTVQCPCCEDPMTADHMCETFDEQKSNISTPSMNEITPIQIHCPISTHTSRDPPLDHPPDPPSDPPQTLTMLL